MTIISKSNFVEYETWFDKNIDPWDLENYVDKSIFSTNIHEKFYKLSSKK